MKIPLPLIIEDNKRKERERNETHRPFLELPLPSPAHRDDNRNSSTQNTPKSTPSRGVTIISIWGDDDDTTDEDNGATTISIF